MKILIALGILYLSVTIQTNGQRTDNLSNTNQKNIYNHISFTVGTQFPVQHLARLSFSLEGGRKSLCFSIFLQGGVSGYFDQSIDFLIDKSENANQYLKQNLQPLPGLGAGIGLCYRHWSIELLYQNTGYKLKQKNARELVENLLPEYASYIATDMDNFSRMFPMFGNVYSNYKLTSEARLHQISGHVGYKFLFSKNGRLGGEFKLGALAIFESNLRTNTEQTNDAADYLISLVNSYLDEELREDTQWLIVPTASVGLFVRL